MCSTAAMAISLILHHIPQKVTEMESEATGNFIELEEVILGVSIQ